MHDTLRDKLIDRAREFSQGKDIVCVSEFISWYIIDLGIHPPIIRERHTGLNSAFLAARNLREYQ